MEQKKVQGGAGGGVIQGMALNRNGWMAIQATARTEFNGGIAGGKSHGGEGLKATMGTSGGIRADGVGALSADRQPKEWSDTEGPRGSDNTPRWKQGTGGQRWSWNNRWQRWSLREDGANRVVGLEGGE